MCIHLNITIYKLLINFIIFSLLHNTHIEYLYGKYLPMIIINNRSLLFVQAVRPDLIKGLSLSSTACLNKSHTHLDGVCAVSIFLKIHEVNMSQVSLLESIMSLLKVDLPWAKERETGDNVYVIRT